MQVAFGSCLKGNKVNMAGIFIGMTQYFRTDTGGLASVCGFLDYSGTIVARILYYTPYQSVFLYTMIYTRGNLGKRYIS